MNNITKEQLESQHSARTHVCCMMLQTYNSSQMLPTMDQLANFLQAVGYFAVTGYPHIIHHLHLLISALLPIYAGAHASLSRPSSAAKPSSKNKRRDGQDIEMDAQEQTMEALSPIDALLLPLLSGLTLASLYFLIVWLEDPALLNKTLNWYLAVVGVWFVAQIINDSMGIFASLIFPEIYDADGNLPRADGKWRKSKLISKVIDVIWNLRKLDVRIFVYKAVQAQFKIGLQGIISILLTVVVLLYYNLVDKPWWLINLLGFGFAYGALQLMLPTTSWTGTLLLGALLIYDIYFVFFTPMMVTVATQLDIPAMLVFPRPRKPTEDPTKQAFSMLGLGDIVLPGMMMSFALRFDLYLFYLRKQARRTIKKPTKTEIAAKGLTSKDVDDSEIVKATWHPATGGWGERFWMSKNHILRSKKFQGVLFPKTYFRATVIGYVLGMLCTLSVMNIYDRAQPALLYLVPGVLGFLWGTALVKGDLTALWNFDISEEGKETEARTGKVKGDSAWKADRWLGIDWKDSFLTSHRSLSKARQPTDVTDNGETDDLAANGHTDNLNDGVSRGDLANDSKSSGASHEKSTGTGSENDKQEETRRSPSSDDSCREDEMKSAFDRDCKSELVFISINLPKAAR